VVAEDPRRNAELKREFDRLKAELKRLGPANFQAASGASDPLLHERLRSLGYVE
jgi:hypothetical protein